MIITDLLKRNAWLYGDDTALVEINPELREKRGVTWREYELVETNPAQRYRREMTWREFNYKSCRFANMMLSRGITGQKGCHSADELPGMAAYLLRCSEIGRCGGSHELSLQCG